MARKDRTYLKTKFENGDIPVQRDYSDVFDSFVNFTDDVDSEIGDSPSPSHVPTTEAVSNYIDYALSGIIEDIGALQDTAIHVIDEDDPTTLL